MAPAPVGTIVFVDTTSKTQDLAEYLRPTPFIDSDHPAVVAFADDAAGSHEADIDRATSVFYAVRDGILYTPYGLTYTPETMTASYTLAAGKGFCVQKAVLLAAASRAIGVPSRLGFADVVNHLATERLLELLGTDLFIYHGYTEMFLGGRWVKATPAFNITLCERFGVLPLDFDGTEDSVLQPFDGRGRRHMEYVREHGAFADLPFDLLRREYDALYPGLFAHGPDDAPPDGDFGAEAEAEHRAAP